MWPSASQRNVKLQRPIDRFLIENWKSLPNTPAFFYFPLYVTHFLNHPSHCRVYFLLSIFIPLSFLIFSVLHFSPWSLISLPYGFLSIIYHFTVKWLHLLRDAWQKGIILYYIIVVRLLNVDKYGWFIYATFILLRLNQGHNEVWKRWDEAVTRRNAMWGWTVYRCTVYVGNNCISLYLTCYCNVILRGILISTHHFQTHKNKI